jgi:hypothetical protein
MDEQILWEYRAKTFGSVWKSAKADEIADELNSWGEEGWEVISSSYTPSSTITVIAKRPLTETEKRRRSRSSTYG